MKHLYIFLFAIQISFAVVIGKATGKEVNKVEKKEVKKEFVSVFKFLISRVVFSVDYAYRYIEKKEDSFTIGT